MVPLRVEAVDLSVQVEREVAAGFVRHSAPGVVAAAVIEEAAAHKEKG